MDRAQRGAEPLRQVGHAVGAIRVKQQGGQDVGLQSGPEHRQQRGRGTTHNPKLSPDYTEHQLGAADRRPSGRNVSTPPAGSVRALGCLRAQPEDRTSSPRCAVTPALPPRHMVTNPSPADSYKPPSTPTRPP